MNVPDSLRIDSASTGLYSDHQMLEVFLEGPQSPEAAQRMALIKSHLRDGFLDEIFDSVLGGDLLLAERELDPEVISRLNGVLESLTSENGRALVALTFTQLAIKCLTPEQSIRLHKGGGGSNSFSWVEGISFRSLDREFITPWLRQRELLRLNQDGFMMTRSFAENYPYTRFYKAKIRGDRESWLAIIDAIEGGICDPRHALVYLTHGLLEQSGRLEEVSLRCLQLASEFESSRNSPDLFAEIRDVIAKHVTDARYSARLFEVAAHSALQAIDDMHAQDALSLVPLSQMRSANKKHGNVGDIEIIQDGVIVEAWDCKFDKEDLTYELKELEEKLENHASVRVAGFITSRTAKMETEYTARAKEVTRSLGCQIETSSFDEWLDRRLVERRIDTTDRNLFAQLWLTAYIESLARMRLDRVPMDEPTFGWISELNTILAGHIP